MDSQQDVIKILLQIVCTPEIPQRRSQTTPRPLKRLCESKLTDHDVRNAGEQLLGNMLQKAAHATRRTIQPAHRRIRRRTNREPIRRETRRARTVGEAGVRAVAHAGVEAAVDFVGQERRVRIDGVEIARPLDHVLLLLCEVGQEIAERGLERRRVVAVCPGPAEPANAEVEVSLAGFFVAGRGAVSFVVVAAVLEGDSVRALKFFMVPFCDFGVREECVVAAEEAGFWPACDVVGRFFMSVRFPRVIPLLQSNEVRNMLRGAYVPG
jgi:hypothetical protein